MKFLQLIENREFLRKDAKTRRKLKKPLRLGAFA